MGAPLKIRIGQRIIGENEPTFIVAEAACNHMCQIDLAQKMIDYAVDAGVDAIKFQTYKAESLVTQKASAFWGAERGSQLEYYRRLDRFGKKEYAEIFEYAKKAGIIAFSTPFDEISAQMLEELDVPLLKVASCDINNASLLKCVADFNKPTILSTGASSLLEIDKAICLMKRQGAKQLMLMACKLGYPTKAEDANLLRIKTLKKRYSDMIIGLSDHTFPDPNMIIPSIAVALGAKIIEKHYTLDHTMKGSGHFFAVDPHELKKMVYNIRVTEKLFGDGALGVSKSEERAWRHARRSIVAERLIRKGEIVTAEKLGMKRPGDGLSGHMIDRIIGKRARIDIKPDEKIRLEILE